MTNIVKLMIALAVIIATQTAFSVANSLRMMNANNGIKPQWESKQLRKKEHTMQALYIGEKPYIKVRVNGQEDLLFLIDTGAAFTIIDKTEVTARLSFESGSINGRQTTEITEEDWL